MSHLWLHFQPVDLETELAQCAEEGKVLSEELAREADRLGAMDYSQSETQAAFRRFLEATISLAAGRDEPSDLDGIRAARPPSVAPPQPEGLERKLLGAWTGRACGCLLGKPVEGWLRERVYGYLRDAGRWPLSDYFRYDVDPSVRKRYELGEQTCFIDRVSAMPEDDDMNYTVTALAIYKKHGPGFTPNDVADFWLDNIPVLHTCTAERVAYRNLVNGILPPQSATHQNPYREWIGAQIRADFWGYVTAGNPELAAEYAWRDACISHIKNGIYGEMWSAAMNAAAFVLDDPRSVIEAGLAQIPARCRLAESVREVMLWRDQGASYDEACARVHERWDETRAHHWCHTISNACIVSVGLLWGEMDFGLSVCRAVQGCFDTDCNGATVGSIMGAMLGIEGVPERWRAPLNDTLETGVAGYHRVRLSDLAAETLSLVG